LASARYTIDSSSLINGWVNSYPRDVFPGVWEKLEELIEAGVLIASEEVIQELKRKDDDLYKWAKGQVKMHKPSDIAVQKEVLKILKSHRLLVDTKKNRSGADPFVIATGITDGCSVVTQEQRSENPAKKPHIPDVCDVYNVKCLSLLDLLREQGWVFVRS
jgi:hypothetical protein